MKSFLTIDQLKNRIQQLNNLIGKFPTVRSLVRKWGFELVTLEGQVETLETRKRPETPKQLTIWDVKPVLEITHRKTYEYKEQIKSLGCKWNPSKRVWVAPNEEIFNKVAQMLEDTDDIRSSCSGWGYSEMTAEAVDEFFATDKIEAQPNQFQSISYTPTKNDAIKLLGNEQVERYWDERIPTEASKILASGEDDETEIFDRLNYEGMKGKSVDILIDLVNHFRHNPPTKESEFKYIELVSYRSKGINAYLCPVINGKADYTQADYGKPTCDEEQERAHRSKKHTVKIRYDHLPTGLYQWKEAGGADNNKARYGWMKIVKGECIAEGEGYPPRS